MLTTTQECVSGTVPITAALESQLLQIILPSPVWRNALLFLSTMEIFQQVQESVCLIVQSRPSQESIQTTPLVSVFPCAQLLSSITHQTLLVDAW